MWFFAIFFLSGWSNRVLKSFMKVLAISILFGGALTYLEWFFVLESMFIPRVTATELPCVNALKLPTLQSLFITQTQWRFMQPKRSEEDCIVLDFLKLRSFIHLSSTDSNNNILNEDFTVAVAYTCSISIWLLFWETSLCILFNRTLCI